MNSENSDKFLPVLTEMSGKQNPLENRIDPMTQKLNSPQETLSNNNYEDNQQQTWRGNFSGRTYQNRGNRRHSNNQGYQYNRNYRNNQNQGSINYKTATIAADMIIISIEETIEGEITLEAMIGEISRITTNLTSITAIFSCKDIKITKQ